MEIDKQEKVHHETEVCEHRRVKCHDCGNIKETVGRLERNLVALDGKVERAAQDLNKKMDKNMEANREMKEQMEAERITNQNVEASSTETKKGIGELKKEVNDIKENLSKVNKDVDEVKVMMIQVLEKLNMLELLNKLPSPAEGTLNTPREDILIAGGYGGSNKGTEIYSWEKNAWFEVSPMNEDHEEASSFIDKGQVYVVGGDGSKTIETLDLNKLPLKWTKFRAEFPYECFGHQTVVCQQSVIHIGGHDWEGGERCDVISELQLTSSCAMKELCQMPEPRQCHRAEVFEDKVLILGGFVSGETTDSVLEFDATTNQCKEMRTLPFALSGMATVQLRDEVVVLGGEDKNNEVRNDVFMYNSKTGNITPLPSMLEKRCHCCAVITKDTVVVMGGENDDHEYLSSVECLTMGNSTWEYLPHMNYARKGAVAEVLPSGRKYV
jgi:archaellum component FlaC